MSDAFLLEEWNHVFVSSNINEVWYKWNGQFFSTVESFIPREKNRTSRLVMAASHHLGSVTTSVALCVQKNRLFKRAQSFGEPDHWRVYWIARNKASIAVKAAKKNHLSAQAKVLADPNCSSSKWWRVAKEMCGRKANPWQGIPPLVNSSADLVCDDSPVRKQICWMKRPSTKIHPWINRHFLLGLPTRKVPSLLKKYLQTKWGKQFTLYQAKTQTALTKFLTVFLKRLDQMLLGH